MTLRFPALPRFFRIAIAGVGLAFSPPGLRLSLNTQIVLDFL